MFKYFPFSLNFGSMASCIVFVEKLMISKNVCVEIDHHNFVYMANILIVGKLLITF